MEISALRRIVRSAAQVVLVLGIAAVLWPASLGGKVHYVMVAGTSMEPRMHTGDLVLVREAGSYEVGDAVAYRVPEGDAGEGSIVIHRITGGDAVEGFMTQGDNRNTVDTWRPTGGDVLGKRQLLVPGAGSVIANLRNPLPLALLAAGVVFVFVAWKPAEQAALSSPG